jgi:enoyl-CoA hydratase/carnithine racemase
MKRIEWRKPASVAAFEWETEGRPLVRRVFLYFGRWSAVLGLPEVSVGVIPGGGGTQLLARRIGWSRAADLIFTARRISAAEAYRLGLADRLVPEGRARTTALELAARIAANSPVGVRNAKRAMRLGLDVALLAGLDIEDAAWRATAFSGDRKEGIAAFNEKRTPDWPGE